MSDIKKALYAGVLVGIGDIVYTVSGNVYVGAMLFSLPFIMKMLAMNFIGVLLVCCLFFISHAGIDEPILKIARDKFACRPMDLYNRGILCGMCMYIAVSNKRQIITIFSIMTFILCGFRHCIADFPFLIMNFSYMNLLKFIMIVLGNSMGAIAMNFLTNNKKYA